MLHTSAGELVLSSLKVSYSLQHNALFVADVHMGKAATFRQLGVPVPHGTTQENLQRLSDAIDHFKPTQVYFLGDFLHAKQAHNVSLLAALHVWRQMHVSVQMILIRGNHDDKAGDPPHTLNFSAYHEPYILGGFALCHYPQTLQGLYVLAGHEHPVVVLNGKGKSKARLPCFYAKKGLLIQPAFGSFTGGMNVRAGPDESIFPVVNP